MRFNPKILISIILLITFLFIGTFYLFNSKQVKQKPNDISKQTTTDSENVDYTASFAIYTNGTFRIFTAPMYHNLSADVFIEASDPNIVNIKKSNITWRDFFAPLPFSLSETCLTTGTKQTFCSNQQYTLQFYLNGQGNDSVLDQIINSGDKLLVTYEKENASIIQEQLQSIPSSN